MRTMASFEKPDENISEAAPITPSVEETQPRKEGIIERQEFNAWKRWNPFRPVFLALALEVGGVVGRGAG